MDVEERPQDSHMYQNTHSMAETIGSSVDVPTLLQEPNEYLDSLERMGTEKLGEFWIDEKNVVCAFGGSSMLTMGLEERTPADIQIRWNDVLQQKWKQSSHAKRQRASSFTQSVLVEMHVVTIQNAAGPPGIGLLQPVLVRWQSKAAPLSVFNLPAIQTVLHYKWNTWAKKVLLVEFAIYLLWLISTVIFAFGLVHESTQYVKDLSNASKTENNSTDPDATAIGNVDWPRNVGTVLSNICGVLFMFPFLVIELNTLWSYKISWFRQFWNMIDSTMYGLQLAIAVLYLSTDRPNGNALSVILAIQCILLFAKIQYFSRVFDTSRGSLVDILKMVISDVKWFLLFIFLTMASFGIAFNILYRDETLKIGSQKDETFASVPQSIVSMFAFMLGGFHFDVFYESKNKEAAIIFFIVYESVMAIMLLNLLIAIMTDSYGKVMADERLWNLCSKAQIIDELETTLPLLLTSKWDRPFIHLLAVVPRKNVNLNSLWTKLDMTGEQSIKNSTELMAMAEGFRVRVVEKLHEVRRKVDARTTKKPSTSAETLSISDAVQ